MKMFGRCFGILTVLFLLANFAVGCGGENPIIKVHVWEGTGSHLLNNAILEFVVENGYGYPVEEVVETTPVLQDALPEDRIDLNLEGWQQNIPNWYDEQIRKGEYSQPGNDL